MPGSCDKEEKRNALRLHHTNFVWRVLDACLMIALRIPYAYVIKLVTQESHC